MSYLIVLMLMLMPVQITATNNADMDALRQQIIQVEVDTRAYRQKMTGGGL